MIHTEKSRCKVLSAPNWQFGLCRDFYYNNGQCMIINCKRLHFARHIPYIEYYMQPLPHLQPLPPFQPFQPFRPF